MSAPNIDRRARRVHPNSVAAFESLNIARRQRRVLDAIRELHEAGHAPCDSDVAYHLGWSISRITPRRGELVAAGLVVPAGNKIAETGRKVSCWRPDPQPASQLNLFVGGSR